MMKTQQVPEVPECRILTLQAEGLADVTMFYSPDNLSTGPPG